MSHECLLDLALLPLTFLSWFLPSSDLLALALSHTFKKAFDVSFTLPYSRELEMEADLLGVIILAKVGTFYFNLSLALDSLYLSTYEGIAVSLTIFLNATFSRNDNIVTFPIHAIFIL